MISHGKADNITLPEILSKISESEILYHYLGIKDIPCVINSPLREDRNPSFGLYSIDGERICYRDFSTKETGNTFTLLKNLWGINFQEVLNRIQDDLIKNNYTTHTIVGKSTRVRTISNVSDSKLDVKIRDWRDYDLKYWGSYGITLDWLKWADVYPISYIIITKEGKKYTFPPERRDGRRQRLRRARRARRRRLAAALPAPARRRFVDHGADPRRGCAGERHALAGPARAVLRRQDRRRRAGGLPHAGRRGGAADGHGL